MTAVTAAAAIVIVTAAGAVIVAACSRSTRERWASRRAFAERERARRRAQDA